MQAVAERNITYVVCTGLMGVGKTRTGKELLKSAREKHSGWKWGYLSSAAKIPVPSGDVDWNDIRKCDQILAYALCETFLGRSLHMRNISLATVEAKLKRDLGDKILLQVDEFAQNPLGVRMLMRSCSHLRVSEGPNHLKIVVVVTGVQSLMDVTSIPPGSRYEVSTYSLAPLREEENDEKIRLSFMRQIKMTSQAAFEKCDRLQNLITDCGGFPASLEALANRVLKLDEDYLEVLRAKGHLDVSQARELYGELLKDIRVRYSQSRWASLFLALNEVDKLHRYDGTSGILRRILLDVITASGVRRHEPIDSSYDPKITYAIVETGGLVSLKQKAGSPKGSYEVIMPMLAASCMNEYLHAIQGDVLENPFRYGFQVHEELALISLQARLRRMAAANIKTCTLNDLRPGALLVGDNIGQLLINVPEACKLCLVGRLFEDETKGVNLRPGEQGDGEPPSQNPGTMLMAAVGKKAVDGALLLEGSTRRTKCFVFLLSQSKWSDKPSTTKVQKHSANEIVEKLSKMKDQVVRAWLGSNVSLPIYVVYDVFSDRPAGATLVSSDIYKPHTKCAVAVTTEDSMESVVGPVLAIRSCLKRIAKDEASDSDGESTSALDQPRKKQKKAPN